MIKSAGFTLIELLLTVTIITALGIGASTYYSRFLLANSIEVTKNNYIMNLRKAQTYAALGKNDSNWGVRYSSNEITLFKGASYASRDAAFDQTMSVNTNITISGLTEIVFTKLTGIPTTTGTITLSAINKNFTITVNSLGAILE